MKNIIIGLSTLLVASSSCEKQNCPQQACTEEFKSIIVDLEFNTSNPMIDSTKTFRKNDNKLMQTHTNFDNNHFVVLDDADKDDLSLEASTFISKGYFSGQEIFSEEYEIKHDCCHIIKVSGKDTINL